MMPFDVGLYLKLIGYSLRDAKTPRRVGRVLLLALLCPAIVAFGSLGMLLDWVCISMAWQAISAQKRWGSIV